MNKRLNSSCPLLTKPLIAVGLVLCFGCASDAELSMTDTHVESVEHALTPMWDTRPSRKKHTGKRHQLYRSNDTRRLNNHGNSLGQPEGVHWVRETGFRPGEDENEAEFVRETGFMPAPRLTLESVEDGVAHLSWSAIADVGYYILNGRIVDVDQGRIEQHGTSFILRGNEMSVDLDGQIWHFQVTAVGNNKAFRSKASNRVQADPNGD